MAVRFRPKSAYEDAQLLAQMLNHYGHSAIVTTPQNGVYGVILKQRNEWGPQPMEMQLLLLDAATADAVQMESDARASKLRRHF